MPVYLDNIVHVHIPKCGGTSVSLALEQYSIAMLFSMGLIQRDQNGEFPLTTLCIRKHENIREIKDYYIARFGENRWQSAIKFSVIRNPADRIASWFDFRQRTLKQISELPGYPHAHPERGEYCWDAFGSAQSALTPEELDSSENCFHYTDIEEIEKFCELNFHEYIHQATAWKHSGCNSPECPYHLIDPQVNWITDDEGNIDVDALFRLEKVEQLNKFLPDMPLIPKKNSGNQTILDYRKQLTEDSLRVILDYYAKDFELYSLLKREEEEDNDDVDSDCSDPSG